MTKEQTELFNEALVVQEAALRIAFGLHPSWPENQFEQLAIIGEEFGELQKAVLQGKHEGGDIGDIAREASHLAAMSMRFLMTICED